MSIQHSIAKCKKPIATGSSRQVFYSKKYDVIIKTPYLEGTLSSTAYEQTKKEQDLFLSMNEKERRFFPIIEFVEDKNKDLIVIMKKSTPLNDLEIDLPYPYHFELVDPIEQKQWLQELQQIYNIEVCIKSFMKLVKKWGLRDLHYRNLGVCENKLVILDFGW